METGASPSASASRYTSSLRRKILIVEDGPSISNILYVLLEGMNYEGEVALSGQQALAMIGRESFDAVLLDLRYSQISPEQIIAKIKEIRPSLLGRVLVITGEVESPETLELIERHCLPHVAENRLLQDVMAGLRALPQLAPQS